MEPDLTGRVIRNSRFKASFAVLQFLATASGLQCAIRPAFLYITSLLTNLLVVMTAFW